MTDYYFLSVEASNLYVEVLLNGVPFAVSDEDASFATDKPIAEWLLPGKNRLDISLKALSDSEVVQGTFKASIYLHDQAFDTATPKTTYVAVNYPDNNDIEPLKIVSKNITFNFDQTIPVKLWNEATTLNQLDHQDKQEVVYLIDELRHALLTGNVDKLISLQKYKIMEDALAENKMPEQITEAFRSNYEWLGQQSDLESPSLVLEDLRFSRVAQNKLVYVTDLMNQEALQMTSDTLAFEVPIFVAKINNKWILVR